MNMIMICHIFISWPLQTNSDDDDDFFSFPIDNMFKNLKFNIKMFHFGIETKHMKTLTKLDIF